MSVPQGLIGLMTRHPHAEVIAHPECEERLLKLAGFVGSTSALLAHVVESPNRSFIVATEEGILHQMRRAAPDKELIPAPPDASCSCNTCPHMKRNTMEKLYLCLRDLTPRIEVEEAVRMKAKRSIDRRQRTRSSVGKLTVTSSRRRPTRSYKESSPATPSRRAGSATSPRSIRRSHTATRERGTAPASSRAARAFSMSAP